MDMEVCTTLGMLSPEQAQQLKQAGLTAYNHNLDTSREFYPSVITTRKYDERLETIEAVRAAGLSVCSGGIVGLGEKDGDRVGLIYEMSQCVVSLRWSSIAGLRIKYRPKGLFHKLVYRTKQVADRNASIVTLQASRAARVVPGERSRRYQGHSARG